MFARLLRFRVRFDEVDVRFDLRDVVFPVVLVLDGDIAIEVLLTQLFQAGGHIDDSRSSYDHFGLAICFLILEVDAHDASIEDAEALDWDEVRRAPVAEIGTCAQAMVATLDDAEDVEWIPDLVVWVAHGAAVLVESDLYIGADGCFFPCGYLFGGLAAYSVEPHFFRKVHDLIYFFRGFAFYDAVVHSVHALALALGEELIDLCIRHSVADFDIGFRLQSLARVKFNHVPARLFGFGDGLEGGEFFESVCLCPDEPAILAEIFRNWVCVDARGDGECGDGECDVAYGFHKLRRGVS